MNKQNKYTLAPTYRIHPFLEYLAQFSLPTACPPALEHLADGVFMLRLCELIKDFVMVGEVVEAPRTLSQRLSNLKVLFRSIERFWNAVLGAEIEGEEIDLVEAGRSGTAEEITRLLELLVKTAVQAENKSFFIERVLLTSQHTQEFLKGIIEKVFQPGPSESPRKQKEKRMLDKIIELDHQNDKLHAVLQQVCEEKLEVELKLKAVEARLAESTRELEQFEHLLRQDTYTPQKKRTFGLPDTSDRKDSLIDALHVQVAEMAAQHERELQSALGVAQRARLQCNQYEQMRDELALSRQIIASHQEFREQAQIMEQELSQARADLMSKDNLIACLRQQLERSNIGTAQLEASLTGLRGDIERKNIQIGELIGKLEEMGRASPRKGENNLLLELPDLVNTEAEAYMETNRSLREQLERSRRKLQLTQQEVAQQAAEIQNLRQCSSENRKLREMVVSLSAERGEENEILVSSLYHLRKLLSGRHY